MLLGWEYALAGRFCLLRVPAIYRFAKAHVAEAQIIIGNAPAAREQLKGELYRFETEITFEGLKIGLTFGGCPLEDLDDRLTLQFVGVERAFQVSVLFERAKALGGPPPWT